MTFAVHPVAALFPRIEGVEFDALVDDIRVHGLLEPITLSHDGKVLIDGRNRLRACEIALVDPIFTRLGSHYTESDIVLFIVSKNLKRRQLDAGQRAMLGVKLLPILSARAKERQKQSPGRGQKGKPNSADLNGRQARDDAARAVGVGHTSIDQARAVADAAPSLAREVLAGNTSLHAAYKQVRQKSAPPDPKPAPQKAPDMLKLSTHDGQIVRYKRPQGKATFNKTNEQVSWAAWTWNPVTGCLHGCPYCYARELATRASYKDAYPVGFTPLFHHERLDAPANTSVPADAATDERLRRVFVCSMADLYGKWVPQEWIDQVHASAINNPQWDYLMLTKFPRRYVGAKLPATAWLGTSVDEQKRVRFAEEAFRQIKNVRVKWLSLEPLLAPLQFSDLSMFDWIVIGSQTETEQPTGIVPAFAPPFEWVARLVAQAREAGCRVYLKPNLLGLVNGQSPGMQLPQEEPVRLVGPREDKGRQLRLIS
jgi:protein gp37